MHEIKRQYQQILLLYLILQKYNQNEDSTKRNQCDSDKISANQWDGQYIIATLVENNYTNVLYYTQNNIGSTSMLTDINGDKVQGYLFTPYGEEWITEDAETSVTNEITRKFTGQEFDKESGLYYYNARYYDPKAGIFITPDPAMDGLNHYAYCSANPINFTDPNGLEKKLTIYVDQLGKGGDNDTYKLNGFNVDVGHTFVQIEDTDTGEKSTRGFYPSESVNPIVGEIEVKGTLKNDTGHDWDVKKEFKLTDEPYKAVKQKIEKDEKNPGNYNLDSRNCTNWTEEVTKEGGQNIPDTK
jgi:RHS repeat-associated protein